MKLETPIGIGFEEDHAFRSQAIHWLLTHEPTNRAELRCHTSIPRILVQYWHNLEQLPNDVAECMDSWNQLENNGFEVIRFDEVTARRLVVEDYTSEHVAAFDRCYHPAMQCDYFRLCFIHKYGGFYVDTDEIYEGGGCEQLLADNSVKLQPLCYDLSAQHMIESSDFLRRPHFDANRIYYVNNNPIIAPPGHALIRSALQRSTSLLIAGTHRQDIQSTTGPGNLSATLLRHAAMLDPTFSKRDFAFISPWSSISRTRWDLSYRNDERNWRLVKI